MTLSLWSTAVLPTGQVYPSYIHLIHVYVAHTVYTVSLCKQIVLPDFFGVSHDLLAEDDESFYINQRRDCVDWVSLLIKKLISI